MSLELIGTLTAIVLAAGVVFGGLWTLLAHYQRRIDDRFAEMKTDFRAFEAGANSRFAETKTDFRALDAGVNSRFAEMKTDFRAFEARINDRFSELQGDIASITTDLRTLSGELTEVKLAVARLECPAPRLLRAP